MLLTVLVAVFGLFPAIGFSTVAEAVAQAEAPTAASNQSGAEQQQGQSPPGDGAPDQDGETGFIEIHLVECPAGFQSESGAAFYDTCHSTSIEDVTVTITSVATAPPVTLSAETEQVQADGPGVATFGALAEGDYEITIDLPEAEVGGVFAYCSIADGDDEVPVSPDDALTGTLSLADDQGVICDWYITPPESTSAGVPGATTTIDLLAFRCDQGKLPSAEDPTYAAFADACIDPAPDTSFHLLDDVAGEDTVRATDANGRTDFSLDPARDYRLYADVPIEDEEFMWCAVDRGEAEPKIFDDRGVTTFDSGDPRALTCSWFLIEASAAAPTAVPTAGPTAAPTVGAAAQNPGGDLGQIVVSVTVCPQDYDQETQGVDFESLSANCTEPVDDVSFTFNGPDGLEVQRVTEGEGALRFGDLEPGAYTLLSGIPLEAASEYLFCTADGGNRYQKEFSDTGVTTFADLKREQIACDWFVVPSSLRGEETGGSLEVHLAACPVEYTGDRLFEECHGNGVADAEFTLAGPATEQTGTTTVAETPGPGSVTFTSLDAGEYTLRGGPPGDFGAVRVICTDQATDQPVDVTVESTIAEFAIAENQDVLCDWYYLPDDASGPVTPTPTPASMPEPSRAEILVTLYACPAPSGNGGYGGATLQYLRSTCAEPVDDVPFTLGDVGAAPLKASTGASGAGAVRFYELLGADYTLTPSLPADLTSTAIFCTVDDGDPYQKALENGATRFTGVDGESIACSWFAARAPETRPAAGPTGSITIREYLCEDARADIRNWDTECAAGRSGSSFTLTSSDGDLARDGTPDGTGVFVFSGLADGFYALEQNDGMWCRAVADRVDRDSRVIVQDGGNTDVVLYQCSAVDGLPATGTGPGGTIAPREDAGLPAAAVAAIVGGVLGAPLAIAALMKARTRGRRVASTETVETSSGPIVTPSGKVWMRFK